MLENLNRIIIELILNSSGVLVRSLVVLHTIFLMFGNFFWCMFGGGVKVLTEKNLYRFIRGRIHFDMPTRGVLN